MELKLYLILQQLLMAYLNLYGLYKEEMQLLLITISQSILTELELSNILMRLQAVISKTLKDNLGISMEVHTLLLQMVQELRPFHEQMMEFYSQKLI